MLGAWVNFRARPWFDRPPQSVVYSTEGSTIEFHGGTI
jgi:hypothetical protein